MPNALCIGVLGPLQVRDESGRLVSVGGRQLRVLFTLLALNAGRVVPAASLADQIWPDDPPGNPGNALQTLVSRLRAELRLAGFANVIESHPAGYRLAVPPEAVDVTTFEALAAQGRRALADGDAETATRILREALRAWRGQPLADAAGCDFADVAAARLTELRSSVLADRIDADLALGEGAARGLLRGRGPVSWVSSAGCWPPTRWLSGPARCLCAPCTWRAARPRRLRCTRRRELLADRLGVDPSAQLEQVYLRILRGEEDGSSLKCHRANGPSLSYRGAGSRAIRWRRFASQQMLRVVRSHYCSLPRPANLDPNHVPPAEISLAGDCYRT